MAESSAMNSDNKVEQSDAKSGEVTSIKKELDVLVKAELLECVVCVARSHECFDIYCATTAASGASLHQFLCKFTHVDLSTAQNCSKFICKSCFDLINVLEQAELEYVKLKETFEAIISKNPLFEVSYTQQLNVDGVKTEEYLSRDDIVSEDSEDEPLARAKKKRHRKVVKKKKKLVSATSKRKVSKNNHDDGSWECSECNAHGETGGAIAETAHKLAMHTLTVEAAVLRNVKTEDSADVSQSPEYSNGFDNCLEIEFGNFNNDNSSGATEDYSNGNTQISKEGKHLATRSKTIKSLPIQKRKKKATKVMHQCDQCSARYSSLSRLEQHKQKHDGSKPPYICEVCGAHYKHKRACDIHIAMHKGISDWKCEECNKLFPSKNALQRHNNIHTGKLNYQCDLCGKSFIHTSSFKMHKLSHSGVKPHACDVCGLALMTRSHLKRHKRIHSGEKRYECAVCGKRFSERYNMMAHSKSHDALEPRSAAEPRRRLFRCTFCPERFERRYMLERHVSAAHGRTLERPPPTPRNTMSKLLKAQAHARVPPDPAPAPPPRPAAEADTKDDGSSESRATPITPQKLIAHLSSSGSAIAASSWSGAYAAEFGLRADFH